MAVEVRLLDDEVRDDSARARRLESRTRIGRSLAHCRGLTLTFGTTPSPATQFPCLACLAMGAGGPWSVSALTMRFELS